MIKKLTKFGRSTLSVILCLTMLLTTFCFFDIGSVISNAMVTVTENNKMKGSLSSQFMYAPEIAYLKPGSSAFQYFSNYDPATGKAISTNDATSRLEFDYKGATEIAIGVNKVYYKNGENDVDFSGTLKINNVTVTQNKVAYNATTSTSFSSIASSASGAISVTLNASQCSLTGAATGTTYYIQWVFRYKVDGAYHFAFMYTGVYVPLLDQAGTSTSQRYIKSGSNPTENHSWSFITGAMKYSGGNRKSQFLGTTANKLMAAPLVSFVGRAQNENNYTIPGGDGQALNENNFSSSQTPYNTFVYNRGSRGKNELYYDTTSISVPSSYSGTVTGNVSITNTGDGVIGSGITLGMAYIVVDTSRYTNYNQIPYLSAGYAQFYHDLDGNGNKLNSIKSVKRYNKGSSTSIAYDGTIYCDVDTSNYTDHDSYSVARGLYKFNGSIIDGLVTFDTWFYNGYKHITGYTESIGVHHYNGLYTEKVDKQTLRTVYNDASHSHIDYKTYSSGYSAYYTELKSVAETLCNPQLYSKTTTSLSGTASGSVKAIETSIVNSTTTADNYVYFYVPEVIYLTPGKTTFQYYSDMSSVSLSNGVCTPTVNSANKDTTGNIYFYYKNASKVKITQSGASSVSLSGGNVTSFNSYVNTSQSAVTTASISGGSVSSAASTYITWTATYVEDNIEKTVTAKSYVYSPYVGSVAAAALGRDSSGECESATSIIWGIHGLKENVYKNMNIYYATNSNTTSDHGNTKNGYGGGYNPKPILTKPTYDTNGTGYRWFNRTDPYNNKKVYSTASGFDGMSYVYRDSGNGGMVAVSGIGSLYVDTSRFSNFGQIPNFAMFTNHDSDSNMCRYAEIMTKSVNSRTSGSAIKQTVVKGDKTTYSSTKPQAYNISGTDLSSFSTSGVASFILYAYSNNQDRKGEWTNAYSAVDVSASDRSGLRKAVEYAAKYSYALQAEYFNNTDTSTDYRWTAYVNALSNAQDALTKVDGTADFGTYNVDSTKRSGLAKTLMDAVDVLLNANRGTAPRNTSNYTATQKNVGLVANSNGTFTVAAIAEAASDGTASISKTFKAYDKVEFSAEQYEGYKYVGYIKDGASSNGDAFSATDYNNMVNSTDPVSKSKNETLVFGNAKNVNYSYTFYYILNPDVLFDNEFDFDQWALKATFSGAHSFDMATNTATITNPGTSTDYSTSNINGTGSYYMNVLPNHTYRISMKVKMGSTAGTVDYMAFAFRDANRTNPSVGTSPYYSRPSISLAANAEGTLTSEFKIPSDASYMTLRLGLRTASITASFSDIYIQDITTPGGFKDDVTDATPHANLSLISGSQIGNVASISRTGYAFDGWYNNQDSTGNGTGTKYTSTSTVGNSNLRLYAKWTVAPELMFDNEFRFDNITASDIASGANNSTYDIDYGSNKLRLNAKGSDAYTGQWYGIKSGAFAVTPGHTYRIRTTVKNTSSSAKYAVVYIFCFADSNLSSTDTNGNRKSVGVTVASGAESTIDFNYTVQTGRYYGALRFGINDSANGDTAEFSNIYVQDTTSPGGVADDVTPADPINKVKLPGETVGSLADIERSGYTFTGWNTAKNGTGTTYTESTKMPSSNTQLWSQWDVNSYTITFAPNGGSVTPTSKTFTINDSISLPTPTRTGYTFSGWKVTEKADVSNWTLNDVYTGTSIPSGKYGNVTLTAQWTVNTYTITYKYNNGAADTTAKYTIEQSITLPSPTKTGYTFAGWKVTTAGGNWKTSDSVYKGTVAAGKYGNVTLTAQWTANTYTITYVYNNGSANTTATYNIEQAITLPSPTKTGYTFAGWKVTTAGGNWKTTDSVYKGTVAAGKYGNVTLTAQWTVNTYTITYKYNNGAADTTAKYTIEQAITLPSPTKTGYTFAGWKVTTAGGNWKTTDSVYKGTVAAGKYGNVTLTARWTANVYTITFLPNGGSVNPTSKTFTIESTIDLPTPMKDGYVFDGWLVTKAEGSWTNGTLYTDSSIAAGKYGNVTVTAQWHKTVTVHFYSGSKGAVHNQFQITFKNNETAGSVKSPASFGTIDGWTALGWTASTAASKAVGDAAIKGGTTITVAPAKNEYVYYAVYTQSQTLKYESNANGDTSVKNIPANGTLAGAYYNSSDAKLNITRTIPSTVPTRNGYTFKSWNTQANGSGTNYAAGARYTNSAQIDTLYAQWTENQYTITYVNGNGNADSKVGYKITAEITIIAAPTYDGYVFVGWKVTTVTNGNWTSGDLYGAGAKIGSGKYGNVTLVAQWVYVKDAETKADEYNQDNTISIVTGVDGNGNTTSITTTKYDAESFKKYQDAINAYNNAKKSIPTDINASNYSEKLSAATKTLQDAINALVNITLTERGVVTDYLNNFLIDSSGTRHNLNEMNLNHYDLATTVETAKNALVNGNAIKAKSYGITAKDTDGKTFQTKINEYVAAMAKAFKTKTQVKTEGPGFKVYENADAAKAVTDANGKTLAGATAVNYAYAGKGNYTYYCYTNSTNPTVLITVDDIANSGRVCYPTTAKATAAPTLSGSAKNANAAYTITKIPAGNADNDYLTYTKLSIGGASSYYQQKQVITLTPEFTSGTNGTVTYEFTATDDALTPNVATQSALSSGIGDANSWQKNLADDTTNTKKITIVIDYHSGDQMTVTGDQVNRDTYLNQYHLFRQSGGASNWELPKTGDKVYKVNDGTYKQTDRGSFTFTYELGATDIGNGKINTTDVNEIIKLFKDESNYSAAKKLSFVGTKYWTKNSNGTRVQHEGSGLGYQVWGNNWSFNYYPKSESYTYVHLVDRWGNAVDKVFYVGKQDIKEVTVTTASADGAYTILEDGGSGIDTLSLNAGTLEILTDENSTLENNVYRTTGNTVRIKTAEANKSYTLSMKDKATNASTATLESDGNGIITLSIDDAMYKSGVYTFMLNGTEINLYDGVNNDKYIVNVYDGEAEEGEAAEMIVITTGEVGKTRFTDTDGNTVTVAASETNEDGTKTWRMSKSRPAGEYEYRISVKVGHDWIEENSTGKLIFTEKQLDTGRIVKAEYDEESGLYKLTIEGRVTKIQFITEDGMTRTYTRYSEAVKSRKSYDAEGNEVPDTGRLLDHEVWLVNARLYSGQNYTVAGKFEAGWNREGTATLTGH